jgi:pilus assembly protein FimV
VVRTIAKGILAVVLALPLAASAAGLGRLTVHSPLGQPFNAEIEIISLQPGEEESLSARLASGELFRRAGIEPSTALLGMRFAIERREGRPVIRITGSQPVNEPFLDMLVELQWNTGRLVREYTFLLDPAQYKAPAAVAAAPEEPTAVAKPAPAPAQIEASPLAAAPERAAPVLGPAPAAAMTGVAPDTAYQVKRGDTLYSIARQNRPSGATLQQMLVALFRANQDAFIQDNVNLLREGRILNIPGDASVASIDSEEARRLVEEHAANFSAYRRRLAAAPDVADAAPARRESAGMIEAKPRPAAPPPPQDQMRLEKADAGAPVSSAGARAARGDDLVARDRALQEAQSRIADLERNIGDLQKLLEIRNQQLAELERRAAAVGTAAAAPVAAAPAAPVPAAEAAKPAAAAEAPKLVAQPPKPKPAAKAKAAPPAAEPSFFEELLDNPTALGGLLGIVVLLAGYGVWSWRRKKAAQAGFQDSVLGATDTAGGPGSAAAEPKTPPVASQPQVSAMEAEEVDPIAEADVYMAYGRDAQAEEILKEALQKDPSRVAIHAKLLEIYANRRDTRAFEQTAVKLKGLTKGSGVEWDKAVALGRSLDPAIGLFGAGAAAAGAAPAAAGAAAAAAPKLDFDLGTPSQSTAELPDIMLEDAPRDFSTPRLDFDLGPATGGEAEPEKETKEEKSDFTADGTLIMEMRGNEPTLSGLDLDLGLDLAREKSSEMRTAVSAAGAGVSGLDFDLNLDLGEAARNPSAAESPVLPGPLDLSAIDLDLSEPGEATTLAMSADPKWQEVATKLDLAKAYEEMGDKEGARELLGEVVREGDATQKGQAERLLAKLS